MSEVTEQNQKLTRLARWYANSLKQAERELALDLDGLGDEEFEKFSKITNQLNPDLKPTRRPKGSPTGVNKPR